MIDVSEQFIEQLNSLKKDFIWSSNGLYLYDTGCLKQKYTKLINRYPKLWMSITNFGKFDAPKKFEIGQNLYFKIHVQMTISLSILDRF